MHQLTKILCGILLIAVSVFLGCGSLGATKESISTTSPTVQQIQRCREIMFINPDVVITANGYCEDYGFQNDSTHFKFGTDSESIDEIFRADIVPSSKFKARSTLKAPRYELAKNWWNPSSQSLVGGDFIVPDPRTNAGRELHIGIETDADGTFTVYVTEIEI